MKRFAKLALALALTLAFLWILHTREQQIHNNAVSGNRDSIAYWAAGRLLLHGENPYSPDRVFELQREQGLTESKPRMLRPPPWSAWMILPLGFVNAYWAWIVWIAASVIALIVSVRICWRLYGNGGPRPPQFLIAAYVFAPLIGCLVWAQMSLVLLLGIAVFFLWEEERPHLAGAALTVAFAKPHIFAVLWPVLAVWVVARKKWQLLAGFVLAFAAETLVALALDPRIFAHYNAMLHSEAIENEFIPTLIGIIRVLYFRPYFWVQFVPMLIAVVWGLWFYWRHRKGWTWREHGPWLLVVSLLTTPYDKFQDETVVLPAILAGVAWLAQTRLRLRSRFVVVCFVCLNLLLLLILNARIQVATGMYAWSPVVWFAWYWYASRFRPRSNPPDNLPVAEISPKLDVQEMAP
jgi:Glycosyltransferase family 87